MKQNKNQIVSALKNAWSAEKLNKQSVGRDATINRFGVQCRTISMKTHVVNNPSKYIKGCNTLQRYKIAILDNFQV